mmetsp:Transcript_17569/g.58895  ORF Transcript_17569/g.58895 Transcript_17569/m.58895 type:complete len:298 (+) Transcript_17569:577-1470(+)
MSLSEASSDCMLCIFVVSCSSSTAIFSSSDLIFSSSFIRRVRSPARRSMVCSAASFWPVLNSSSDLSSATCSALTFSDSMALLASIWDAIAARMDGIASLSSSRRSVSVAMRESKLSMSSCISASLAWSCSSLASVVAAAAPGDGALPTLASSAVTAASCALCALVVSAAATASRSISAISAFWRFTWARSASRWSSTERMGSSALASSASTLRDCSAVCSLTRANSARAGSRLTAASTSAWRWSSSARRAWRFGISSDRARFSSWSRAKSSWRSGGSSDMRSPSAAAWRWSCCSIW